MWAKFIIFNRFACVGGMGGMGGMGDMMNAGGCMTHLCLRLDFCLVFVSVLVFVCGSRGSSLTMSVLSCAVRACLPLYPRPHQDKAVLKPQHELGFNYLQISLLL